MVNPVNPNRAALPSINDPIVDVGSGIITDEWYRWCLAMLNRTGGASGSSTTDAATVAAQALSIAEQAATNANTAISDFNTIHTNVDTALTIANGAQATASTALTEANAAMAKAANLSDVANLATARTNLGVSVFPISYSIMTLTAQAIYTPVVQPLTVPASFTCVSYCATPPSSDATLTLNVIRVGSGLVQNVGTIKLHHGAFSTNIVTTSSATLLNTGDTLQLLVPTSDAANVGITIIAT